MKIRDIRTHRSEVHPLHVMAHRAGTRVPGGVRAETMVRGSEVEADCLGFLSSSRRGAGEKMYGGDVEESNVWQVWWFRRNDRRERDSSGAFKHGDSSGSGGGRRHDGGVVIIMAMERSRAASVGGGKSGVAVAGEIHRRRLGMRA
uniref:Uncharacterized protein n=1 Tax=Brassica campestris TaxID=3711 RepID=M4FCW3_BRACM